MKAMVRRKDIGLLMMQLGVWGAIILIPPLVALVATRDTSSGITFLGMLWFNLQSPVLLYFINFYILWPLLAAKRRYVLFVIVNILVFLILNPGIFMFGLHPHHGSPDMHVPKYAWLGMFSGFFIYFLLNLASIFAAIVLRHFLRTREIKKQLEEERHKNTEAELAWLKNQINPHFLFNTLNNISSLVQIDPDASQDAIAQLSDLLRYAMYETQKPHVSLAGEVEFMKNYVELMRLRCNEKTTITTHFDVPGNVEVAPLLFISLIENAFKHGVSNTKPSFIDISLTMEKGMLVFNCDNSNHPKDEKDRSGSGIGIENTRRRLDLLYKDCHQWEQTLEGDTYHVKITIKP